MADEILIIGEGRLLESGTHDALVVVALNEDVLGGIPVDRVLLVRHQGRGGRCLCGADSLRLAGPGETETFTGIFDVNVENRLESFEVDFAVGNDFGEEVCDLGCCVGGEVRGSAGTELKVSVIACSIRFAVDVSGF
ncbi:hypothetical protein RQN30_11060 [Arcanobacterium hippocoleae]